MCKMRIGTTFIKCISVFVAVLLMLSVIPFTIVYAVDVDTESELKSAISSNSAINLTADITLSSSWSTANYSGTLTGNGHIITTPKTVFNTLSGTVKDLGVIAESGFASTSILATTVTGTVDGCYSYGTINTTSTGVVGGLVGTLNTNGKVTESFACVDITANSATYVGGLIGKINGGTVNGCYSSGSISVARKDYNLCKIGGLGNYVSGTVSDTYTTCQLRQPNTRAKASGVNGLYDNQLSIVRESSSNQGLSTLDLMKTKDLSTKFAVSGTSYPALHRFYQNRWSEKTDRIVRVSTAAVSFADVDAKTRLEPTGFAARADYLTLHVTADRTNGFDLEWNLDSDVAKVLDTVPMTSTVLPSQTATAVAPYTEAGTMSDLLRSEFIFSAADTDAKLTVSSGDIQRVWYLNVNTKNPYFYKNTGSNNGTATGSPFWISTVAELNVVRHYGIIGSYHYRLYKNISCSDFDPIVDFRGNFMGNSKELQNIKLTNADGLNDVGVFATTRNATVRYLTLKNVTVTAQPNTSPNMGCVIGSADSTQIYRNIVTGSSSTLTNTGITGGVVGKATGSSSYKMYDNLVSATIHGASNTGGIAGEVNGAMKVFKNGSTGILVGTTNLGGLIGKTTSTSIENSYSTMAVISTASDVVNIGGLVGSNGGTITKSYAASLVYAKNASGVGPLVGSGTQPTRSYYEGLDGWLTSEMVGVEAALLPDLEVTTSDMISSDTNGDSWLWTKTANNMPQITYFTKTTRYQKLSLISTTPVYFQKYWNEAHSKNMTTGWITNTSSTTLYNHPIGISKDGTYLGDGAIQSYAVADGIGFEIGSSGDLAALSFVDKSNIGIRAAGAIRDNMFALAYDVTGVVGVNTYVEIGHASSKTGSYTSYQVMSVSGGTEKVLYDIPSDQYIRVKVKVKDDYKVESVTLSNGVAMTLQNGYYVSSSDMNMDDVKITIKLASATPPWGLHQQAF